VSNRDFKQFSGDAYFWCDTIDDLYASAKAAGARFLLEPEDQFYGLREFQVKDCDGRVLTFGSPIGG
jgi:uncharacterized glyoxalase superfamily protein PhnB